MEAVDLSPSALAVAKENAARHGAQITFLEADLYQWEGGVNRYDFIVSNPPYIPQEEAPKLSRRVYNFEPHLALFVPTCSPLKPYERIAYLANNLLQKGGFVACEIYETLGTQTAQVFAAAGLKAVNVQRDFWNKDRMVFATKE